MIYLLSTINNIQVAIGYEWGSKNHPTPNDKSPDDNSNKVIAEKMKGFAGSFSGESLYPGMR